jgi:hypothetical protein
VQGGQGEIVRGILPARTREQRPHSHSKEHSPQAQATAIPTPPSSKGLSGDTVVQNSTPTRHYAGGRLRESQLYRAFGYPRTGPGNRFGHRDLPSKPAHLTMSYARSFVQNDTLGV